MRTLLPVLMLALAPCLLAQTVNEDASRFLSAPHGRSGCLAPYRLVVEDLGGDTLSVASLSNGVRLERQVAVAGLERVEIILPVEVSSEARIEVAGRSFTPRLPLRRVDPDYRRPYVAVFSPDPVGARAVLPGVAGEMVCDYFELGEFFTDWRLLDGYDALVIFNAADVRLPRGSQRTIAEFCSLGGAVFNAGSFRFGEQAVNLPAPTGPEILPVRDVTLQRFGYGAGSIYRVGWREFTGSRSARRVVRDALLDHLWYGGREPPGGELPSRIAPRNPPLLAPLPPAGETPGPVFWGLAGALLVVCLVPPLVARRFGRQVMGGVAALAGCVAIGGLARMQDRPLPSLERAVVVLAGDGEVSSTTTFVQVQKEWGDTVAVNLDDNRRLPRRVRSRAGWNGWVFHTPLAAVPEDRDEGVRLESGRVGGLTFRDFSTGAQRGETSFSKGDAALVEWWLEANAWRGRAATLAPIARPADAVTLDGARARDRGAIRVSHERVTR